jgi:hypothetical protein
MSTFLSALLEFFPSPPASSPSSSHTHTHQTHTEPNTLSAAAAAAVLVDPFAAAEAPPAVEWWDLALLPRGSLTYRGAEFAAEAVTHFIEVC